MAVILREGPSGDEVLLVRRASRRGDPWSGHVSFPGGVAREDEADPEATAVRETREEVGLDLAGRRTGALPTRWATAHGTFRPMSIEPVVFRWAGPADPTCGPEVVEAFWLPLAALRGDGHRARHPWWIRFFSFGVPAWEWEGRIVWGLTAGMLVDLLRA